MLGRPKPAMLRTKDRVDEIVRVDRDLARAGGRTFGRVGGSTLGRDPANGRPQALKFSL
jgi:hypothetical protein